MSCESAYDLLYYYNINAWKGTRESNHMNFQDITYFLTLCGEKTFSAAADKLFITQQGLSKAIRRMENEIGAPLFERGRKTLALTPSGDVFVRYAQEMRGIYARMRDHMERLRDERHNIRLGMTMGVPLAIQAVELEQLRRALRPCELELTETTDFSCEEQVASGAIDFGVTLEPVDQKRFACVPLLSRPMYAVAPQGDPLARQQRVDVALLRGRRFVLADRQFKCYGQFHELCRRYGFTPDVAETTMETLVIYRRCLENGWIGVSADLPRVMNDCPGVVFVPFDTVEFAWNITLISAADRQLTPFEQSVQKDIAALFR